MECCLVFVAVHQLQRVVHVAEGRRKLDTECGDLGLGKARLSILDALGDGGGEVARGGVLHEQPGDALDLEGIHEPDDVLVLHLLQHLQLELRRLDLIRRELLKMDLLEHDGLAALLRVLDEPYLTKRALADRLQLCVRANGTKRSAALALCR